MTVHDQALSYLRQQGPSLPLKVSKYLGMTTLFASAILSELVDRKQAFFTHATIGNSPLYYLSGQESRLGSMLYEHLNAREKEAYNLLQQYKILAEKDVGPVIRVALRDLHDFAKQFTISDVVFWRQYLLSEAEAQALAQEYLSQALPTPKIEEVVAEVVPPVEQTPVLVESVMEEKILQPTLESAPVVHVSVSEKVVPFAEPVSEQKPLPSAPLDGGSFYKKVQDYFEQKKIQIVSSAILRKNSDFDFVVSLPSALGPLSYYIKVKGKVSISETDVSVAFSEAQTRNLPGIMLIHGKMTKKAQVVAARLRGKMTIVSL